MRVFYVIYVTDYELRKTIDAIRLLADPSARWPAHITVRGPYETPRGFNSLNRLIRGEVIRISGPGMFYHASQNTVFLMCQSPALRTIWDKPGFGFTPHITLYDGHSRRFADSLLKILAAATIDMSFIADALNALISGDGGRELCPACIFSSKHIESIIGIRLSGETLRSLDDATRLLYIDRLWKHLAGNRERFSGHTSYPDCLTSSC